MEELKTLTSCTLVEFLRQTNRIKKTVEKWLADTDILNIRKNQPKLKEIPDGASEKEASEIKEENKKAIAEQVKKNTSDILDAALDKYPEETAEVIALCCFVEPDDMDNRKVRDYIIAFNEMMNDEAVIGFFISLVKLGQTPILTQLKA